MNQTSEDSVRDKIKILITGAAGQVAQALREEAPKYNGLDCVFLDKTILDITSSSSIREAIKNHTPEFIINTAGYTAVDAAEENRELALQLNSRAIRILAQECKSKCIGLIHLSTDYVFDGKKTSAYIEGDRTNPQSVYGVSKRRGEKAILNAKLPVYAIIRTSWVYSTYGSNFVKTMLRLARERTEVSVVNNQIGSPTYANDLANALLTICTKVTEKTSGIYHYSNKGKISWYQFAKAIFKYTATSIIVNPVGSEHYPVKAKRPKNSVLSTDKISESFNLEILDWKVSLQKMLSRG
ncbi:dTDP-4-dehydrorhamnose reductase [Dokdonia sp. Hel_I_53]|uniref:dTDP-4-dehydrorhamnose reductase n=1 Tax=Dokdonia sp. Hel_I_53 TaxID=1566287 RepID=UPI00119A4F1E|nr:dTDP-4-dehydrorhamnose reductase [Dokdonia sp. Hel_I_53]TVZ51331.1 dTDP-4-dehydrorhamnose reductase [Dokdonia sp. Hel_I_53]